uniref:Uncharacterized protein n=1 Tax=Trypanosoma congolense (strain IL3000) TaxID=1068625 RepID=G0V044_TRYCI|nr:conserved hypothetical protein [Trypanosoma congolense IL3000]
MQVLDVEDGGLCALSPNQSLFAIVKKGLDVVFIDYIRRTSQLRKACVARGSENVDTTPNARRSDAIIFKYTALDEISELRWSPDSTLVALLLSQRGAIEIVSVYGRSCVARVDAGILGLRALCWHPSSRAIYWVSLFDAHVFSLLDGHVMQLLGGVKYSLQAALRYMSTPPSIGARGLLPRPGTSIVRGRSSKKATGTSRVEQLLSEAALLRFSTCRRFLFYVTTKRVFSPLCGTNDGENPVRHPSVSDSVVLHPAPVPQDGDRGCSQRRSEWLVVLSATTHEGLYAFPTARFVSCVSECIAVQSGIVLIDYTQGCLALTTFDGARAMHCEPTGVHSVSVSKCGGILFMVFGDGCRTVLVSKKRVVSLRHVSFAADVALPLRIGEIDLLEEPQSMKKCCEEFLQVRRGDWSSGGVFAQPESSSNWLEVARQNTFDRIGQSAISASGRFVAVTLARWPTIVFIMDIVQQRVLSVLCHRARVVTLCWAPASHSAFWRFQWRHYMQRPEEGETEDNNSIVSNSNDSNHRSSNPAVITHSGLEEPLLITTDNHESKVFFWLVDRAICFLPVQQAGVGSVDNIACWRPGEKESHRQRPKDGLRLRINRGMFGEDAAGVVLVDDQQEVALMAAFDHEPDDT